MILIRFKKLIRQLNTLYKYLKQVGNVYKLKSNSAYYQHIQGRFGITGRPWCDFFQVKTKDDYLIRNSEVTGDDITIHYVKLGQTLKPLLLLPISQLKKRVIKRSSEICQQTAYCSYQCCLRVLLVLLHQRCNILLLALLLFPPRILRCAVFFVSVTSSFKNLALKYFLQESLINHNMVYFFQQVCYLDASCIQEASKRLMSNSPLSVA